MKKSASIAGTVLATTLLLGACGDTGGNDGTDTETPVTDENDTTGTEDTATEPGSVSNESSEDGDSTDSNTSESEGTDSDQDYMKEKMDKLAYEEFELEVDYGKDKEYEVEIEKDDGMIEASVEDELSNKDLSGREAFDDLYPKVKKLEITEATSKEAAINQTLDAFKLDDNYVKFEIEITMKDGQKIEFEDEK